MRPLFLSLLAVAAMAVVGCETNSPNSQANQTDLNNRARTALQQMQAQDPKIQDTLNNSVGYVIFPDVGAGAVGVGGASGEGVLYRNGQPSGTVKLDQVSVGAEVGGQSYSELIVLQNDQALNRLMNNALEFGTEYSATMIKAGAAGQAQFSNGVAIFILPRGGLSVGVNINGQKFHYMGNTTNYETNTNYQNNR